jgi:hypothetical protein
MKRLTFSFRLILIVAFLFESLFAYSQKPVTAVNKSANVLRFKNYIYIDQKGTGIEAFRFLMPSAAVADVPSWKQVFWQYRRSACNCAKGTP